MLIDCDTCTVRGQGCDDCVVTVLLGAPPGWRGSDPTVVPLIRRPAVEGSGGYRRDASGQGRAARRPAAESEVTAAEPDVAGPDTADPEPWSLVELDDVEQRAVRALADVGLVPPLRHQDASTPGDRHVS